MLSNVCSRCFFCLFFTLFFIFTIIFPASVLNQCQMHLLVLNKCWRLSCVPDTEQSLDLMLNFSCIVKHFKALPLKVRKYKCHLLYNIVLISENLLSLRLLWDCKTIGSSQGEMSERILLKNIKSYRKRNGYQYIFLHLSEIPERTAQTL